MKLIDMDVKNRKLIFEGGVEIPVSKGERVISAGLHHTYVHTYIHTYGCVYVHRLYVGPGGRTGAPPANVLSSDCCQNCYTKHYHIIIST